MVNDFGQFTAQERERPADADDVDRHVEPIEHQDAGLQCNGRGGWRRRAVARRG